MHTALPRTVEAFEALCAELSNWQRWDAEDELGTLNLLSAERIAAAGRLVERGAVFSLALPLGEDGPHRGATRRFNPLHLMLRDGADEASGAAARDFNTRDLDTGFADDIAILPLQAGTHWDALSHCMYKGVMYGGRDAALVSSRGARRNDIMGASRTLVGRGVLLDLPRARAVPWLEGGAAITGADLAECARAQGADVLPGDVLLVRTGRLARAREEGWGDYADPFAAQPGIGVEAAAWLHEHDLAALATDTVAAEVRPSELPLERIAIPFHVLALVYMGMPIGEMFDLEALAADCAADGRYAFQFVGPPLPFRGSVGAPANPVAIK